MRLWSSSFSEITESTAANKLSESAYAGLLKGDVGIRRDMRMDVVLNVKDLDGFSHVILLYHFHRIQGFNLHVVPFMDDESR